MSRMDDLQLGLCPPVVTAVALQLMIGVSVAVVTCKALCHLFHIVPFIL